MINDQIIQLTADYVKSQLTGESSGHDWWHVFKVWTLAKRINQHEGGNSMVIELAALLHDIADWKFHDGDENVGPRKAQEWLRSIDVDEQIIQSVTNIIARIAFRGALVEELKDLCLEEKIVQDADRLDAMGAMGIARTFAYGGFTGRPIYDPDIKPMMHKSAEEYVKNFNPSLNHFYEKLLLLKDRINTPFAKELAEHRHQFMLSFLEEFFDEWEGRR